MAKADAMVDGIQPKRGMWLVHREKGRTYGQIVMVRQDGTVVWHSPTTGSDVPTDYDTIHRYGYSYAQEETGSPEWTITLRPQTGGSR